MKIIAWNVNGLNSLVKTDYLDTLIKNNNPDILCLSETKLTYITQPNIDILIQKSYPQFKYRYWHNSMKKNGYSGTVILLKKKPKNIKYGLLHDNTEIDTEGRLILVELNKYFLLHVYTPNSGEGLNRLTWRVESWDRYFENYIDILQKNKPVIICGDLNIAHKAIDLKNPTKNLKSAGYTIEERNSFDQILNNLNLIDVYRFLYPDKIEYTYWTYKFKAREKNIGWRIDYFLVSKKLIKKIINCSIIQNILGSDHAPIELIFYI